MSSFAGDEVAPQESVLQEAHRLVNGNREADYGHPRDNMQAIATLIQAWLESRYRGFDIGDVQLDALDGAMMLLMMKAGRIATGQPKRDTFTDLCGYGGVAARAVGIDP